MMNKPAPAIELISEFISNPEGLLAWVMAKVEWDDRMRARKTASFGVSYNYSQIAYAATVMPPELDAICLKINATLGFYPNNCLMNYYTDNRSSMGFHSDNIEELVAGTGVAIVSLGSERTIAYRNKADPEVRFDYPLPHGSLLYMSDDIQREWVHAIPKSDVPGERISLTFRKLRE